MHTPFYHNPHPFTCSLVLHHSRSLNSSFGLPFLWCFLLSLGLHYLCSLTQSSTFNISLVKIKQWCFTQLYKFTMYICQGVIVHCYLLMNFHYPPSPLLVYLDLHLVCECREHGESVLHGQHLQYCHYHKFPTSSKTQNVRNAQWEKIP